MRCLSSATWLTMPTMRPPSRRPSSTVITSSRVSSSRLPKPSSTNSASILVPPASAVTTSARPRARARLARNVSPPDSVLVSRSTPVQPSQASRPRPDRPAPRRAAGGGRRGGAGGQLDQPLGGCRRHLLQAGGEHERGQGHLERVGAPAGREVGQPAGLGGGGGERLELREARGEPGSEVGELFGLVRG